MNGWQAAALTTLCVVTGTVYDQQHHPLPKSKVVLTYSDDKELTTTTNADGRYRFSVPAGSYRLRTVEGTITVVASPPSPSPAQPAFFDEPQQYKPSGVTDYSYQGGHGSGEVFRSAEAMAKELQAKAAGEGREAELYRKGTELLNRRQVREAAEVFRSGFTEFPKSTRLLMGMGSACYAEGAFDEAAGWFYKATDLDPLNEEPYLFLARVQARQITDALGYKERMERFARLHPDDAWANYYFGKTLPDERAGEVFEKALRLDPKLAAARVELGAIAGRAGKYDQAIREYQLAIKDQPDLGEAHYRLAEAYRVIGERDKAQGEMEIWRRLGGAK